MKINRIHIEQFGTLSDFDCMLSGGLNRICRENGWGKTTLSVFIRVMFYGFPAKGERAKEREKYLPWENGIYGGSLTFSVEDHEYTIYRRFGRVKSGGEDEFRLVDEETRTECTRWSRKIGEELFGINEESFTNSAWISQDSCRVTSDLVSGMGDREDILEDMKRFDQVMLRIEKRMNYLSPSRKTGMICRKRIEKQELEAEILRIPSLEGTISRLEKEHAEQNESLKRLEAERQKLQEWQREYSEWQEYLGMKEVHDTLQREYLNRDEIWEKLEGQLPKESKNGTEPGKKPENAAGIFRWIDPLLLIVGGLFLAAAFFSGFPGKLSGVFFFAAGLILIGAGCYRMTRSGSEHVSAKEAGSGQWDTEQIKSFLVKQKETGDAENAWKEVQKADLELRAFYERNPGFEELSKRRQPECLKEISSARELNEKINSVNEKIRIFYTRNREQEQRIELLLEEREELMEKEEKLDTFNRELEKLEKEYWLLETSGKYLKEAADSFSSGFLERVQRAFLMYYRMIDPDQKERLFLDSGYRICMMGGGMPRTEEVLSRGYRNLAAICLRFAVLDAMTGKERPCVIMDDTLVNFDDEKAERAMCFLENLSDRYQILYLSCRKK